MRGVNGLHHITAIAGPAQENLDFYAGVLGMRLVKRSVNQDDPGTYHLFYADAEGHPGSDLTFFPWAQMAPARPGYGPGDGSRARSAGGQPRLLGRAAAALRHHAWRRRGPGSATRCSPFADPHGLRVALVERQAGRRFTPWDGSPVPPERQIRGLHGAQLWERNASATARFLTTVLGFQLLATEGGWSRYGFPDTAGVVDLRDAPEARRGGWGIGSVHHLAWRVDDERASGARCGRGSAAAGAQPTPVIDRFWFKSVYFKEPGGVLFELATDGPGFAVDEDAAHLGETLVLPPWLEAQRDAIERALPPLSFATPAHARS